MSIVRDLKAAQAKIAELETAIVARDAASAALADTVAAQVAALTTERDKAQSDVAAALSSIKTLE